MLLKINAHNIRLKKFDYYTIYIKCFGQFKTIQLMSSQW